MIQMINKAKGTYDVLPNEINKWQYLEKKAKKVAAKYNFKEIRTPIFEYSQVFHRESELSDMVTKETYNFKDKGDRDLTLRPEGTAGVIRAYVENKLYVESDLLKVYRSEEHTSELQSRPHLVYRLLLEKKKKKKTKKRQINQKKIKQTQENNNK